jgi:hypothetical protein
VCTVLSPPSLHTHTLHRHTYTRTHAQNGATPLHVCALHGSFEAACVLTQPMYYSPRGRASAYQGDYQHMNTDAVLAQRLARIQERQSTPQHGAAEERMDCSEWALASTRKPCFSLPWPRRSSSSSSSSSSGMALIAEHTPRDIHITECGWAALLVLAIWC